MACFCVHVVNAMNTCTKDIISNGILGPSLFNENVSTIPGT